MIDLSKEYEFPDENNCPVCGHWNLKEYSIYGEDENYAICRKCYTSFGYIVNHDIKPLKFKYTFVNNSGNYYEGFK